MLILCKGYLLHDEEAYDKLVQIRKQGIGFNEDTDYFPADRYFFKERRFMNLRHEYFIFYT